MEPISSVKRSSSPGFNEQMIAWMTVCRGNAQFACQTIKVRSEELSSPTLGRHLRPHQKGGGTTGKPTITPKVKPITPRTWSDEKPSTEASAAHLKYAWYRRGHVHASQTERHCEWPHEKERWLHIPMNERCWSLVPHVNRKVSHTRAPCREESLAEANNISRNAST